MLDQVKGTMLVTVWVFIGIEGGSVYSARARKREDVGRATVIGVLICLLLAAESLFTPAGGGVMPKWLAQHNDKGVPANALRVTNGMVHLFRVLRLCSKASYLALISLSTAMILLS